MYCDYSESGIRIIRRKEVIGMGRDCGEMEDDDDADGIKYIDGISGKRRMLGGYLIYTYSSSYPG
jgi:hypothetical protein